MTIKIYIPYSFKGGEMLSEMLSKECINLNLKSATKEEVLDELIEMLENSGKLKDKVKFRNEIFKAELERSTGLEKGIAIPHAKTDAVKTSAIAFGLSKKGIDYHSADGELSHLFFMIATSEDSYDLHIEILSTITFRLLDKKVRKKLLSAYYPENVIKILLDKAEFIKYNENIQNSESEKSKESKESEAIEETEETTKYDIKRIKTENTNQNISDVLILKNDLEEITDSGFLKTFLFSKRSIFYIFLIFLMFFIVIKYR